MYFNFEFKRPDGELYFKEQLYSRTNKDSITSLISYVMFYFDALYYKYPNTIKLSRNVYEILSKNNMITFNSNKTQTLKMNIDLIIEEQLIEDIDNKIILSYKEEPQTNEILVNIDDSDYIKYIKPQIMENNCVNIIKEVLDDASNKYYKLKGYLPDGIGISEKIYNMLKEAKQIEYDTMNDFGSFNGYVIYMLSRTTSAENIINLASFHNKKSKYSNTYKREFKNIHIEFIHNNKLVDYETLYTHPADMLDKQLDNIIESYVKKSNNKKPNSISISSDLYRHFEKRNKITQKEDGIKKLFNKYNIISILDSNKKPYTIELTHAENNIHKLTISSTPHGKHNDFVDSFIFAMKTKDNSIKTAIINKKEESEISQAIKSWKTFLNNHTNLSQGKYPAKPAQSPKITINDVVNLQPNPDILIPILKSNILNLDLRNIKTLTLAGSYYHSIKWLCENFNLTLNVFESDNASNIKSIYFFRNGKLIKAEHHFSNNDSIKYEYVYHKSNGKLYKQIDTKNIKNKQTQNIKNYFYRDNILCSITQNGDTIEFFKYDKENFDKFNPVTTECKYTKNNNRIYKKTFNKDNLLINYNDNIHFVDLGYTDSKQFKHIVTYVKNPDGCFVKSKTFKYIYDSNNTLSQIKIIHHITNDFSEINFISDSGRIHSCSFSDYTTNNQNSFIINSLN